jgi:predicted nucleic acid-binding protein
MSLKLVVDASVAAKWLLKEDRTDEALVLLDETSFQLWAPDYILSEVYNVLCKKVRRRELTEQAAEQLAEDLAAAPITIRPFTDYLQQAFSLALTHSKTVYDCLYLAMALQIGCGLVTNDERFATDIVIDSIPSIPPTSRIVLLRDLT